MDEYSQKTIYFIQSIIYFLISMYKLKGGTDFSVPPFWFIVENPALCVGFQKAYSYTEITYVVQTMRCFDSAALRSTWQWRSVIRPYNVILSEVEGSHSMHRLRATTTFVVVGHEMQTKLIHGPLGLGQYFSLIGLEQTSGFTRGYDCSLFKFYDSWNE